MSGLLPSLLPEVDRAALVLFGVLLAGLVVGLMFSGRRGAVAGLVVILLGVGATHEQSIPVARRAAAKAMTLGASAWAAVQPGTTTTITACTVDNAVATIRALESSGQYDAISRDGKATGAYQYQDATWAGHGGYMRAVDAPPDVQDARARADVERILAEHGDVAAVPVAWYWPRALEHPADMDIVPGTANVWTVREYQTRWLARYAELPCAETLLGSVPLQMQHRDDVWPGETPARSSGEPRPLLAAGLPWIVVHWAGDGHWGDRGDTAAELRGIQSWATGAGKPWEYNYVIDTEGVVWEYAGDYRAAHSEDENARSVGVLLLIGREHGIDEPPTDEMIRSLRRLRAALASSGRVAPDHEIMPHRWMPGAATECPGPGVMARWSEIERPWTALEQAA